MERKNLSRFSGEVHLWGPTAFSWADQSFPDKESNDDLKNKNQRDADDKMQMPGFVMEDIHTCFSTDASADEGEEKQCGFGNAPAFFDSPPFTDTENNKSGYIDNNKIND